MRRFALVLAFCLAAGPVVAAGPYHPAPRANIKLAKQTRVVRVGASTAASDFMSLAYAYEWLADQVRDADHEWIVVVDPDANTANPGTRPTFTTVEFRGRVVGHTVTVAQTGAGAEYTTPEAAMAYVATQTRSDTDYWLVLVHPGTYLPANFVVPTFTHLQGVGDGMVGLTATGVASGAPLFYDTTPTGTFITLSEGASISNIRIAAYDEGGPISGAYTALKASGRTSARNVEVSFDFDGTTAFAVSGVEVVLAAGVGGLYAESLEVSGFETSSSAAFLRATGAVGVTCYACHFKVTGTLAAYVSATGGATVGLYHSRLDAGATAQLVNSASTISVQGTPYASSTGTITSLDTIQKGTTAPATCAVGTLFVDTDTGPSLCVCTAANVWKCAVVS